MANDLPLSASAVEDIAALARGVAEREPYKSASGPDALRAFAAHLEDLAADKGAKRQRVVRVEFRRKKSR